MPTDADRILAPGVPIELNDGRTVKIRFSFLALKTLEDSFGSIDKANAAMNGAWKQKHDAAGEPEYETNGSGKLARDDEGNLKPVMEFIPPDEKVITVITRWMAAGLVDEGFTETQLYRLLKVGKRCIADYGTSLRQAIAQAFAEPEESDPKEPPKASTGEVGTTSPPSPSDEAIVSSGV